jgi:hypothetical protein
VSDRLLGSQIISWNPLSIFFELHESGLVQFFIFPKFELIPPPPHDHDSVLYEMDIVRQKEQDDNVVLDGEDEVPEDCISIRRLIIPLTISGMLLSFAAITSSLSVLVASRDSPPPLFMDAFFPASASFGSHSVVLPL